MSLSILCPQEGLILPGDHVDPPLGAIAVLQWRGQSTARNIRLLPAYIPLVVVDSEPNRSHSQGSIPNAFVEFGLPPWCQPGVAPGSTVDAVLRTVNSRPAPGSNRLAAWLATRLGHTDIEELIFHVVARDGVLSGSTELRQVRAKLGCWPSDLRRLVKLATQSRLLETVDMLAAHATSSTTRIRERLKRGIGVSLAFYNKMPGWEWVLEAAVRMGLGAGGWGLGNNKLTGIDSQQDTLNHGHCREPLAIWCTVGVCNAARSRQRGPDSSQNPAHFDHWVTIVVYQNGKEISVGI